MNMTAGNSELCVGVRILDLDHREMSETLNELRTALVRNEDRSRTCALLRKLTNFTVLHFALEEGMMGATKYPETVVHRRTHQQLIRQLNALAARHTRGGLALSPESLSFLDAWHADHVQQDDLHYGLWLNQAG